MMQGLLAEKLRILRARKGLSLSEAAAITGVTRDTLSDLERGKRRPYTPTLAKIAQGYSVPVEDLLELEEEPQGQSALTGKDRAPERARTETRSVFIFTEADLDILVAENPELRGIAEALRPQIAATG